MSVERRLASLFAERHPEEAGRVLERLPPGEAAATLEQLPREAAGGALRCLEPTFAARCLASLEESSARAVLATLPAAAIARVAARLPGPERERLLQCVPTELAGPVQRLLQYPEGTAGSLMDPAVPAFPIDLTAGEARKRLQRLPRGILYYVYVTDREHRVAGVVNLRELMVAPAARPLSSIVRRPVVTLSVHARAAAILAHPGWREFHALPVADGTGVLQGVLRYETLRRLESGASPGASPSPLVQLFGEIYLSAVTALLEGLIAGASRIARGGNKEYRDDA